jgi:hypothetical protein
MRRVENPRQRQPSAGGAEKGEAAFPGFKLGKDGLAIGFKFSGLV